MSPRSKAGHERGLQTETAEPASNSAPGSTNDALVLATSLVTDLGRSLTCSICVRPLYEPFTSACGHTHCYSCLCHWFSSCGAHKTCADCRAPVSHPPAPAYLIRELTHKLLSRPEFLPEGETLEHHAELQAEEAAKVDTDKANTDAKTGGLFRGLFRMSAALAPIRDPVDGVDRCPYCHWELENDTCIQCGFPDGDGGDYLDEDEMYDDLSMDSDYSVESGEQRRMEAVFRAMNAASGFADRSGDSDISDEEDEDEDEDQDDEEGSSMADFISDDEAAPNHPLDEEDPDQSELSIEMDEDTEGLSEDGDVSVELSVVDDEELDGAEGDTGELEGEQREWESSSTIPSPTPAPEPLHTEPARSRRRAPLVILSDSEPDSNAELGDDERGTSARAHDEPEEDDSEEDVPIPPTRKARATRQTRR